MRITLAYPRPGIGDADETVDVDDATGRTLIADGFARPAESPRKRSQTHASTTEPPAGGDTKEA